MAGEDKIYTRFLRGQLCANCNAPPPSVVHHHTARRAFGRRAHDHDGIPLCDPCHKDFHDARPPFDNRAFRREFQDAAVRFYREMYAECF